MGDIFNVLVDGLGSVLAFFYDLWDGFVAEGTALGLAIVLLTIFINLLVFPLTLKQTRATRAFTAIQPDIKVLVSSGYSPEAETVKDLVRRVEGFLPKPYEIGELRAAVTRALAS